MSLSLGIGLGITVKRYGLLAEYQVGGVSPLFVDDFEKSVYYNEGFNTFSDQNTLTRATIGTYVDSSGILQTAIIDAARFTHDPSTLGLVGLMDEDAVTNLALRSNEFPDAAWSIGGLSDRLANQTTSPDGTTNADKLVENSSFTQHRVFQNYTLTLSSVYTASVFAKADERGFVWIYSDNGGTGWRFNLTTGQLDTLIGGAGTAAIKDFGNGWYRCSLTFTVTDATSKPIIVGMGNGSGVSSYQGDGSSGLFVYEMQVEQSSKATSSITTAASTVTRAADITVTTGISGTLDVRTTYHDDTVQDDLAESVTEGYWPTTTDSPIKSILMYPAGTL